MSSGTMSSLRSRLGGTSNQTFTPQHLPNFTPPPPVENPFFGGQVFMPGAPIPMNFGAPGAANVAPAFNFQGAQSIPMDFGLPFENMRSTFMPVNRPVYQAGAANRAFEAEQAAAAAAAEAARREEAARVPMYDFGNGLEPARWVDFGGDSGWAYVPERTFDPVQY